MSVALLTPESSSRSLGAAFDHSDTTAGTLTANYVNTPHLLIQDRSRIHHGTLVLHVHGDPPAALDGWYWTARDTKGELRFEQRRRKHYTRYADAAAAFAGTSAADE